MNKTNQPQLPFTLEGNVAPRSQVRNLATNVTQLYKIPLSQIRIRPGFNGRIQPPGISDELWDEILGIPDLADGIYASNGPDDPILGDIYKVDEYFYPTEGERRIRALRHLMATGREYYPKPDPNGKQIPVDDVVVLFNAPGTTDLERKRKIGTSGNKMPLTPMQRAFYYLSLKTEFNLSNQQVADLFPPLARQTVDNYIIATELPADIQDKIDRDEIKISNAIAEYRASKKKKDDPKLDEETTPSEDAHKRKKEKEAGMSGDEEEFEQQDNSIKGVSSMGGPKDTSSGAVTVGKDSIYQNQIDDALWKQFINRYRVIEEECAKLAEGDADVCIGKMTERLKMEYILRVK